MKWYYVAGAIVLLLILCSGKSVPVRVKKEQCIDANVNSSSWGLPMPCGDDEAPPASLQDHTDTIEAGGATTEAGFSFNPTGAGVYITYDKP